MRVVLDTNVLVSGTISPNNIPARVLDLWHQRIFEIIASEDIFDEYQRVLYYPHLDIPSERVVPLIYKIRRDITLVPISDNLSGISVDPQDDKFIACAVSGNADFIVSGDDHLLVIKEYEGIPILSPTHFLALVTKQPSSF